MREVRDFTASEQAATRVRLAREIRNRRRVRSLPSHKLREGIMGKGLLLWLVGIPIPVIIVLWLLFFR